MRRIGARRPALFLPGMGVSLLAALALVACGGDELSTSPVNNADAADNADDASIGAPADGGTTGDGDVVTSGDGDTTGGDGDGDDTTSGGDDPRGRIKGRDAR